MKLKLMLPLLACAFGLHAQTITYTNLVSGIGESGTNKVRVAANQVAKVVAANLAQNATISLKIGPRTVNYSASQLAQPVPSDPLRGTPGPPTVAGPAEIWLIVDDIGGVLDPSFMCVEIRTLDQQFNPSNAVVIPADSAGPVEIVLESSADLLSWTPALPGVYGTSTTNRFFRVRALRR